MRRVAIFVALLPVLAFGKDAWKSGSIKVVDTNEWCGRPGIADWPGICGLPRSDAMALFNDNSGGAPPKATPFSQILEIDAPGTIYTVRRTSFDSGLSFRDGAVAQFQVDGKHLVIKFDRQVFKRNGESRLVHDHDTTDILEVRKR